MALFYINVRAKSESPNSNPIWKNSVVAKDIAEAYAVGKAQFKLENPELHIDNYSIEASGHSADKQGL